MISSQLTTVALPTFPFAVAQQAKNANLLGKDEKEAAQVDQWASWGDDEILHQAVFPLILPNFGMTQYFKPAEQKAWDSVARAFGYLNTYLADKTFLVGHRITLADLSVASALRGAFNMALGPEQRAKYPNVVRFYNTVINQKEVADLPKGDLATEDTKYNVPKKEKAAPAAAAAAAPAPKKKSAKKEDDEDEEPLVPAEEKKKNPLDDLPKSPFILDEWKRQYSNKDTRTEALPWFFENFDHQGWSVWRFDFKYNEELTQIFMSANQIGGFFNRLEASRKYVMGTAGVFGEANKSAIAGVVICRGKDYKLSLEVAPDLESYNVSPLDITTPEGKKTFEDFMAWEAEVDGKKWADGKILK